MPHLLLILKYLLASSAVILVWYSVRLFFELITWFNRNKIVQEELFYSAKTGLLYVKRKDATFFNKISDLEKIGDL